MRAALTQVRGAFALAVVHAQDPDVIVAARRVSPLIMGVTDGAAFLASDIPAILGLTHDFFILDDDRVAELRPGSISVTTLDGEPVEPAPLHVDWDLDAARKDGFDDFMAKEMHEQPKAVADTLLDRVLPDGTLVLDEVHLTNEEFRAITKVFVVACGSSYHAGLMAKYAIEHWARLPVEIDIASEFRYRNPVVDEHTLVIGVSQSGETVDTFQAVREAKALGAKVLVISNVVDSSMARDADAVLYTRAGPEIGVAATKTHLAQITALEILALYLAQVRETLSPAEARGLLEAMGSLPDKVAQAMEPGRRRPRRGRAVTANSPSFIFLGRHVGYPVALEGALKLKEISYLRAEGFPAGELKHGPIALVEPGTVVVCVATRTPVWEKVIANVAEVKSRGASVVLVANDGDEETARHADEVLWVPATEHLLRAGHRRGAAADVRPLDGPAPRPRRRPARATWPRRSPSSDPVGGRRRPGRRHDVDARSTGRSATAWSAIGIDAVDIDRFRTVLDRRPNAGPPSVHRRRAAPTRPWRPTRVPRLATRFATKEAVLKALGVGLGAFPFHDVEVVRTGLDAPRPWSCTGGRRASARAAGAIGWHLSLTHTDALALAAWWPTGPGDGRSADGRPVGRWCRP